MLEVFAIFIHYAFLFWSYPLYSFIILELHPLAFPFELVGGKYHQFLFIHKSFNHHLSFMIIFLDNSCFFSTCCSIYYILGSIFVENSAVILSFLWKLSLPLLPLWSSLCLCSAVSQLFICMWVFSVSCLRYFVPRSIDYFISSVKFAVIMFLNTAILRYSCFFLLDLWSDLF